MATSVVVADETIMDDRREFPRIPIDFPLQFFVASNPEQDVREKGVALDISPKGLLLKTDADHFDKGQDLFITPDFDIPKYKRALKGKVMWKKQISDHYLNGLFIENSDSLFIYVLFSLIAKDKLNIEFLDSMLDALSESAFLVDSNMRILSLSKRQPLVPVDREKVRGKKIIEIPSILKFFANEDFNLKQDLQEVFYARKDKQHKALSVEYGVNGERQTYFYSLCYKYLNCPPIDEAVLIQVRDVTALYKLKDNIEKKNKSLFEQYRLTLMGHIVDELLEDIISPLSAVVGRIDLLKMKMAHRMQSNLGKISVDDWLRELEIIDGLVDQITQHCTVAAKRREREKLGAFQNTISINKLVQETVQILSVHERFRKIDLTLDLKQNLPPFEGEYFDWLNAIIALVQLLSREMQTQNEKRIKIETFERNGHLILAISHNAKALKVPLEREAGLSILDLLQKKYKTVIEAVGGNGQQKITFYIKTIPN